MQEIIKKRTKQIGIDVILLINQFPNSIATRAISNQIIRSATSIGANYRAACRSRSDKEFVAKLNIVLEEVDETCFWLEIIKIKNWINVDKELKESNELTAIFVTMLKKD